MRIDTKEEALTVISNSRDHNLKYKVTRECHRPFYIFKSFIDLWVSPISPIKGEFILDTGFIQHGIIVVDFTVYGSTTRYLFYGEDTQKDVELE